MGGASGSPQKGPGDDGDREVPPPRFNETFRLPPSVALVSSFFFNLCLRTRHPVDSIWVTPPLRVRAYLGLETIPGFLPQNFLARLSACFALFCLVPRLIVRTSVRFIFSFACLSCAIRCRCPRGAPGTPWRLGCETRRICTRTLPSATPWRGS